MPNILYKNGNGAIELPQINGAELEPALLAEASGIEQRFQSLPPVCRNDAEAEKHKQFNQTATQFIRKLNQIEEEEVQRWSKPIAVIKSAVGEVRDKIRLMADEVESRFNQYRLARAEEIRQEEERAKKAREAAEEETLKKGIDKERVKELAKKARELGKKQKELQQQRKTQGVTKVIRWGFSSFDDIRAAVEDRPEVLDDSEVQKAIAKVLVRIVREEEKGGKTITADYIPGVTLELTEFTRFSQV